MNQPQWIPPSVASYTAGRSEATIRAWIRAELLPVACCLRTRRLLVNAYDVATLSQTKHRRPTRRTRPGRMLERIT